MLRDNIYSVLRKFQQGRPRAHDFVGLQESQGRNRHRLPINPGIGRVGKNWWWRGYSELRRVMEN
jgi:hypothetical protein